MIITRMKKGVFIRATDTEFSLLRMLVGAALSSGEMSNLAGMTPAEKRVLRSERWSRIVTPLTIDRDRRRTC
jgi:hypothetical protein